MRLSAGYVVFDGLETLEGSIKSIRENVDHVLVSYQTKSWKGTKASDDLLPTLQGLQKKGLIDEIMEFTNFVTSPLITPEQVMQAKSFETRKRQSLLQRSLELGATHYMSIDADEFYLRDQFAEAVKQIEMNDLHATAVRYINYVTPTLHQGYSQFRIPFIYKITRQSVHTARQRFFSGVDPTRGLDDPSYSRSRLFESDLISMHHMEMVRKDLHLKYDSSSRMFYDDRKGISKLVEDIERAKKTGILRLNTFSLGDQPKFTDINLTPCEDLFGLVTD